MRTYVDSGVLITAARGDAALSAPAITVFAQFAIARTVRQLVVTADRRTLTKKETRLLDLLLENVERYERMEISTAKCSPTDPPALSAREPRTSSKP